LAPFHWVGAGGWGVGVVRALTGVGPEIRGSGCRRGLQAGTGSCGAGGVRAPSGVRTLGWESPPPAGSQDPLPPPVTEPLGVKPPTCSLCAWQVWRSDVQFARKQLLCPDVARKRFGLLVLGLALALGLLGTVLLLNYRSLRKLTTGEGLGCWGAAGLGARILGGWGKEPVRGWDPRGQRGWGPESRGAGARSQ
uniref:Uncharacterized protein n=1 Tax=Terrapene triunguis TaxID=2587831 RepID=A0A674K4Q2_9SAUR